jgi:hypothetical protein
MSRTPAEIAKLMKDAREGRDRVGWFPPLVRKLVSRYVEENPEAANAPDVPDHLVKHAFIAPLATQGVSQNAFLAS